jgi:hypothetical protein
MSKLIVDHVENGDSDSPEQSEGSDTSHIRCECLTGDIVKHQVRHAHDRISTAMSPNDLNHNVLYLYDLQA